MVWKSPILFNRGSSSKSVKTHVKTEMVLWHGLEGSQPLFFLKFYIKEYEVTSRDVKGAKAKVVGVVREVEAELAVGIDMEKASGG